MENERLAYENKGQEKSEVENHDCFSEVRRLGETNSVQNG